MSAARFPPLPPGRRQQRSDTQFVPGSQRGLVANASPVGGAAGRDRARAQATPSGGGTGGTQFKWDRFAIVADGAQAKTLTFLPSKDSLQLKLRGIDMDEGPDYTLSGQTVTVLAAADLRAGDVMWAKYSYLGAVPVTPIMVPFGASGWRYLQVADTDSVDRSAVGFDDSAWAIGTGAFGEDASPTVNPPYPIVTRWALDTRLWLRRTIPAAASYKVRVRVDDSVNLYWNGVLFATATGSTAGGLDKGPFTPAPTSGPQTLAARFTDLGTIGFADIEVTST